MNAFYLIAINGELVPHRTHDNETYRLINEQWMHLTELSGLKPYEAHIAIIGGKHND